MTVSISTPITGAAQTGFTNPTYTIASDFAPDVNGKQWAVTALGGTQSGASAQTGADNPFTLTYWKPKVLKVLPSLAASGFGFVGRVPRNVHKLVTRKGVLVLANQPRENCVLTTEFAIPAGSESASPAELRAAISAHIGALNQVSAGIGDTAVTGVV